METRISKLDVANVDSAKVMEAAALVDEGALAAFPTETVYGIACRVRTDSLARLNELKGRDPEKYYTLHIGRKDRLGQYVPTVGIKARKLVERAWPGPLTIIFELSRQDMEKQRQALGGEAFDNLYRDSSIGIRCPDNAIAAMLLEGVHDPVVAPSANLAGRPPAVGADEVLRCFGGQIELILDGGPCKYARSSTVVKTGKGRLEVIRQGVYSREQLEAWSAVQFLFVCTGNSCRSPMAAGIFGKYLAEKLRVAVDRLPEMGYKVVSAGTLDMTGWPASDGALAACAAKGVDIRAHKSRALSKQLIEESDLIFAMDQAHYRRVLVLSPEAASRCQMLAGMQDIGDPMGQPQQLYNNCADIIETAVKKRIGELEV